MQESEVRAGEVERKTRGWMARRSRPVRVVAVLAAALGLSAVMMSRRRHRRARLARRWLSPLLMGAAALGVKRLGRTAPAVAAETPSRGPSFQHDDDTSFDDESGYNEIDEASAESFPASDPPSWSPARGR